MTFFGQKLSMEDVLLIHFEQIVSFCAIIYSNTNTLRLFCENSSLNPASFTDNVFFSRYFLKILPEPKNIFIQVPLVTNFMSDPVDTIHSIHPSPIQHFAQEPISPFQYSVLTFPNNIYRHTCYCLSSVKQFE